MYVCAHMCVFARMLECMHVCVHVCVYACMYTCMRAYMHVCQAQCQTVHQICLSDYRCRNLVDCLFSWLSSGASISPWTMMSFSTFLISPILEFFYNFTFSRKIS